MSEQKDFYIERHHVERIPVREAKDTELLHRLEFLAAVIADLNGYENHYREAEKIRVEILRRMAK